MITEEKLDEFMKNMKTLLDEKILNWDTMIDTINRNQEVQSRNLDLLKSTVIKLSKRIVILEKERV